MHEETSLTLLLLLQRRAASVGGDLAGLGYLRLSLRLKSCWHPQPFPAGCISEGSSPPSLAELGGKAHLGCLQAGWVTVFMVQFFWGGREGVCLDLGVGVVSGVGGIQVCRSRAGGVVWDG